MQNARWKMLSAVALLASSVALAEAKTWYVDPTGGTASSDSYDGTAERIFPQVRRVRPKMASGDIAERRFQEWTAQRV